MRGPQGYAADGATNGSHPVTVVGGSVAAVISNGDLFSFPQIANILEAPSEHVTNKAINNIQPGPVLPGPPTGGTASTSLPSEAAPRLDVTDFLDPPLPPIGPRPQLGSSHQPEPLSAPPPAISPSDGPGQLSSTSYR
jgi:hypothetical protein